PRPASERAESPPRARRLLSPGQPSSAPAAAFGLGSRRPLGLIEHGEDARSIVVAPDVIQFEADIALAGVVEISAFMRVAVRTKPELLLESASPRENAPEELASNRVFNLLGEPQLDLALLEVANRLATLGFLGVDSALMLGKNLGLVDGSLCIFV